jgi:Rieske 2Fe-2S family protein
MRSSVFRELIASQQPGWSLEQTFYISDEIYEIERLGWLAQQWYILAHGSEVREPGSFIVRDLLGESLLIVRDFQGALHAFYNVCRHRGSRICDRDGRSANGFTCPYHGWSYHLDGTLRKAQALPEGIRVAQLGLRTIPIEEVGGIVLASLTGDPQSLIAMQRKLEPGLRYHAIPQARIAARRSYPTFGNWKLVMENFLECYHCLPAHPEYCSVMKEVVVANARASAEADRHWERTVDAWFAEEADRDSPLDLLKSTQVSTAYAAFRLPIGGGRKTQSQDGLPVAPLMGTLRRFDGGLSSFHCEPFIFCYALNDHAVMFQFLPTGAERTDVVISWLTNGSAGDSDVDVERMVWLWDVTTLQDKQLIERNAAGVRSRSYTPGPYSNLESAPAGLVARYLRELSNSTEAGRVPLTSA